MLDSFPNGNPYSYSPRINGSDARRRRSSSAQQRLRHQFPDVVAEVMASGHLHLHGDLGRSSSAREEVTSRDRKGLFTKNAVERSQSQLTRLPITGRVLDKAECQRRSRRSYDAQGHGRSADHLERESPPQLTLVVMGAPRTGKSALVNQFLWEAFLAEYRPTVEEFNWVEYGRADQPESNFLLQLIDSSGSRDFLAMRHLYYRIGDAFMVVYAANDPQSYAEALAMLREIHIQNGKDAPILLVQNKGDLVTRDSLANLIDAAAKEEGTDPEMQRMLAGVRRMRVTAKNLEQVKGAFWWLVEELVRRSQLTNLPLTANGRPVVETASGGCSRRKSSALVAAGKAALTRRRQSMPSRRTASELGIDEESLKRLMKKHETQSRQSGCSIQ